MGFGEFVKKREQYGCVEVVAIRVVFLTVLEALIQVVRLFV